MGSREHLKKSRDARLAQADLHARDIGNLIRQMQTSGVTLDALKRLDCWANYLARCIRGVEVTTRLLK